jgi:hypothetical protein
MGTATATATSGHKYGVGEGRWEKFTVLMGGTYAIAGITCDLSAIFPNKVLCALVVDEGGLGHPYYVPATAGAPATGKIYFRTRLHADVSGLVSAGLTGTALTGKTLTFVGLGF